MQGHIFSVLKIDAEHTCYHAWKEIVLTLACARLDKADLCRYLDPPAIERLQEINVPTLIVLGENDSTDFYRMATILNKKIRNSKRITIKGAGHMPQISTPSEFDEAVMSFLANV